MSTTIAPTASATASDTADKALLDLGKALRHLGYRFITPTPATHAVVNARTDNAVARDLQDVFGWSRPFRLDGDECPLSAQLRQLLDRAGALRQEQGGLARSAVRASTFQGHNGECLLFFHSAFPTLAEDAVFFGPDTYRFLRQLRAAVPALARPVTRAVDIGCGAGAGAVLLAHLLHDAAIDAVDINPAALAMTTVNAMLAGAGHVKAQRSDLLDGLDGSFDLIIANPPYLVDEHQRSYRHGGGALGGELSLAIVDAAIDRLAPGGTLMLYTGSAIVRGGDALRDAARSRLERAGFTWSYEEIDPDVFGDELQCPAYANVERIAAVWLVAVKPR
jgi:methylase of polypeptide subunit release factors